MSSFCYLYDDIILQYLKSQLKSADLSSTERKLTTHYLQRIFFPGRFSLMIIEHVLCHDVPMLQDVWLHKFSGVNSNINLLIGRVAKFCLQWSLFESGFASRFDAISRSFDNFLNLCEKRSKAHFNDILELTIDISSYSKITLFLNTREDFTVFPSLCDSVINSSLYSYFESNSLLLKFDCLLTHVLSESIMFDSLRSVIEFFSLNLMPTVTTNDINRENIRQLNKHLFDIKNLNNFDSINIKVKSVGNNNIDKFANTVKYNALLHYICVKLRIVYALTLQSEELCKLEELYFEALSTGYYLWLCNMRPTVSQPSHDTDWSKYFIVSDQNISESKIQISSEELIIENFWSCFLKSHESFIDNPAIFRESNILNYSISSPLFKFLVDIRDFSKCYRYSKILLYQSQINDNSNVSNVLYAHTINTYHIKFEILDLVRSLEINSKNPQVNKTQNLKNLSRVKKLLSLHQEGLLDINITQEFNCNFAEIDNNVISDFFDTYKVAVDDYFNSLTSTIKTQSDRDSIVVLRDVLLFLGDKSNPLCRFTSALFTTFPRKSAISTMLEKYKGFVFINFNIMQNLRSLTFLNSFYSSHLDSKIISNYSADVCISLIQQINNIAKYQESQSNVRILNNHSLVYYFNLFEYYVQSYQFDTAIQTIAVIVDLQNKLDIKNSNKFIDTKSLTRAVIVKSCEIGELSWLMNHFAENETVRDELENLALLSLNDSVSSVNYIEHYIAICLSKGNYLDAARICLSAIPDIGNRNVFNFSNKKSLYYLRLLSVACGALKSSPSAQQYVLTKSGVYKESSRSAIDFVTLEDLIAYCCINMSIMYSELQSQGQCDTKNVNISSIFLYLHSLGCDFNAWQLLVNFCALENATVNEKCLYISSSSHTYQIDIDMKEILQHLLNDGISRCNRNGPLFLNKSLNFHVLDMINSIKNNQNRVYVCSKYSEVLIESNIDDVSHMQLIRECLKSVNYINSSMLSMIYNGRINELSEIFLEILSRNDESIISFKVLDILLTTIVKSQDSSNKIHQNSNIWSGSLKRLKRAIRGYFANQINLEYSNK